MHCLTSKFVILLIFTLSAASALPTPKPETKDVVRESTLVESVVPKFVSSVSPGQDDDEATEVQVTTEEIEEDEHREEAEEEEANDDDDNLETVIKLIVVEENEDEIKNETEIKAEKTDDGEEDEEAEEEEEEEEEEEVKEDDEDKSGVEVSMHTHHDESENEVESKVEVVVENNDEETKSGQSTEVRVDVEVKTDNNHDEDEGGCDGNAEVKVAIEETEDCVSTPYLETEEYHEEEPIYNFEQKGVHDNFKLEPEFEKEEVTYFQYHPSDSESYPSGVHINHHESNSCHYSCITHDSHLRAQLPYSEDGVPKHLTRPSELLRQIYSPPEDKPNLARPESRSPQRGIIVDIAQNQLQPAESPLPNILVHTPPLPQVEIHPIHATEQLKQAQEQAEEKQAEIHHSFDTEFLNQGQQEHMQELQKDGAQFPLNAENPVQEQEQLLEQEQRKFREVINSQSTENILRKRSAKPKRLPAHHVMEKHLKLAEKSPHLLGVESVEQVREIWEKNLPYPKDGTPMRVGGPIHKRFAGRESRVVEQRQKENELRQAYGRPVRPAVQRPDENEKDFVVQGLKDEKQSLAELSNFGYKLDLGNTDEQIAIQQEQELQEQEQREASCNCDVCQGNAERRREKEQMRHGDAGLLVQLFPPRKPE